MNYFETLLLEADNETTSDDIHDKMDEVESDVEDISDDGKDNDSNEQHTGNDEGDESSDDDSNGLDTGGDDTETSSGDGEETGDGTDGDTNTQMTPDDVDKPEIARKLMFFDDYSRLSELCNNFIDQVNLHKQYIEYDDIPDDEQMKVINYILENVSDIKSKIDYILTKEIKNIDNSKLEIIFDAFKQKFDILIQSFKQINKQEWIYSFYD